MRTDATMIIASRLNVSRIRYFRREVVAEGRISKELPIHTAYSANSRTQSAILDSITGETWNVAGIRFPESSDRGILAEGLFAASRWRTLGHTLRHARTKAATGKTTIAIIQIPTRNRNRLKYEIWRAELYAQEVRQNQPGCMDYCGDVTSKTKLLIRISRYTNQGNVFEHDRSEQLHRHRDCQCEDHPAMSSRNDHCVIREASLHRGLMNPEETIVRETHCNWNRPSCRFESKSRDAISTGSL
jgi:hypothetical protein